MSRKSKVLMYLISIAIVVACVLAIVYATNRETVIENITLVKEVEPKETEKPTLAAEDTDTAEDTEIEDTVSEGDLASTDTKDDTKEETKTATKPDKVKSEEDTKSIIVAKPIESESLNVDTKNPNAFGEEQKIYEDGDVVSVTDLTQSLPVDTNTNEEENIVSSKMQVAIEKRNKDNEKIANFYVDNSKGDAVTFADLQKKGKPIILVAWVTNEQKCIDNFKVWQTIYDTYKTEFTFLFINCKQGAESDNQIEKIVKDAGYTLPLGFDTAWNFMGFHEVFSYPQTFFINTDGYASKRIKGIMTESQITKQLENLRSVEADIVSSNAKVEAAEKKAATVSPAVSPTPTASTTEKKK